MAKKEEKIRSPQILILIVASLGYFVDIYDLILFNVVKYDSLRALGITDTLELKQNEILLFQWQMFGMLAGGVLWGILGDRRGRLQVLFGSILLYSLANIANAYVWDIPSYAAIRFIAGIGLAGELGAGITLVTEIMSRKNRGYGTMIVVTFGALGAVFAALLADRTDWQTSYWVGGLMGIMLLGLRIGTLESKMFRKMRKQPDIKKGDFFSLFTNRKRFAKYMQCIAMGLPVWFVVGVIIALTEGFFRPIFGFDNLVTNGEAIMYCYIGLSAGDLLAGFFSQLFKSRIKVVLGYLCFSILMVTLYLCTAWGASASYYYVLCVLLGLGTGYWALFVTIAAEQFGTNIRSTVTTTVPNFVRGAVIPITYGFKELAGLSWAGTITATIIVGGICIGLAFIATIRLKETFGKDLNYYEE